MTAHTRLLYALLLALTIASVPLAAIPFNAGYINMEWCYGDIEAGWWVWRAFWNDIAGCW